MEPSPLDALASSCIELTSALSSTRDEGARDKIIRDHIKSVMEYGSPIDDFKKNLHWMNVSKPVSLKDHCSEKIVILDFFTYCCINCYHVLADLKELEKSKKKGFAVIGVHCAKFENEKDNENLESAVKRFGISHPVVNDTDATMWNTLCIQCWPTLLILGPGNVPILVLCGEGHREELLHFVNVALRYFAGELNDIELPIQLHNYIVAKDENKLYFPSKLAINVFSKGRPTDPFLAVSDTGNHRILLADYRGTVLRVVGGPDPGFKDGELSEALLDSPQGLCWLSDTIVVVCDTGNHCLRTIHLDEGRVELLAGTGVQGELGDMGGKCLAMQTLSSPWDVVLYTTPDMDLSVRAKTAAAATPSGEEAENKEDKMRKVLLIAMAGSHQIWALFMDTTIWWKYKKYSEGTCMNIVGSGQEAARNSSYPAAAALAQPSGLAIRSNTGQFSTSSELLIADSESSSIRKVSLQTGQVSTLAGGDRNPLNLFAYGDVDAAGFDAKFQHPLAVAYSETLKCVYVADTYNHKIKMIDIATSRVKTCSFTDSITGEPVKFCEPSDICITPDETYLYVADTNNHSIKILNLSKKICEEFKIKFIYKPKPSENLIIYNNELFVNRKQGTLVIHFFVALDNTGKKVKVAPGAPQYWNVVIRNEKLEDTTELFEFLNDSNSGTTLPGKVELRLRNKEERNMFLMDLSVKMTLCEDDRCFLHRFTVRSHILVRDSVKMLESYKVTCRVKPGINSST